MNHARCRFQRGAILVRKADDHRFSGTGHEPQRQGPHVCGDDMLHLCIDMKPHCRIFAGNVPGVQSRGAHPRPHGCASRTSRNHGAVPRGSDFHNLHGYADQRQWHS